MGDTHTDTQTWIRLCRNTPKEEIFLKWCREHSVKPEGYEVLSGVNQWRAEYPNAVIGGEILQKLGYVRVGKSYLSVTKMYGCFKQLPAYHPLSGFLGIPYEDVEGAFKAAKSPFHTTVYLQNGKYGLGQGTAQFEGNEFSFHTSFAAENIGGFAVIPFSPNVLRRIIAINTEGPVLFTPYGRMALPEQDICKLELDEPVECRVSHRESVLLPKDYPNGRWKPLTRSVSMRYTNLEKRIGYRTTGDGILPKNIYDSAQKLERRESQGDRIARLGVGQYIRDSKLLKFPDSELLRYAQIRQKEEEGEYVRIWKDHKLVKGVLSREIKFWDLTWVMMSGVEEGSSWAVFVQLLVSSGMAAIACGEIFIRKDCICIEDALTHYAELVDGSRVKKFLAGILDIFQNLGAEKVKQILLGRI